jgi:hypothetical protein
VWRDDEEDYKAGSGIRIRIPETMREDAAA